METKVGSWVWKPPDVNARSDPSPPQKKQPHHGCSIGVGVGSPGGNYLLLNYLLQLFIVYDQ